MNKQFKRVKLWTVCTFTLCKSGRLGLDNCKQQVLQLQLQLVIEGPVNCPKKVIFPRKNPLTDPGAHKQTKTGYFLTWQSDMNFTQWKNYELFRLPQKIMRAKKQKGRDYIAEFILIPMWKSSKFFEIA
jgi:hypothetical protein